MPNKDDCLVLSPGDIDFAIDPNGFVLIRLRGVEQQLGLAPGLGLMIGMPPAQARLFAQHLQNKADEVDKLVSRH